MGTGRFGLQQQCMYPGPFGKFDGAGIEDYFGIYLGYVFVARILLLQVFRDVLGAREGGRRRRLQRITLSYICLAAVRG